MELVTVLRKIVGPHQYQPDAALSSVSLTSDMLDPVTDGIEMLLRRLEPAVATVCPWYP